MFKGNVRFKDKAILSFDLFEYPFTARLHNQIISALNNTVFEI